MEGSIYFILFDEWKLQYGKSFYRLNEIDIVKRCNQRNYEDDEVGKKKKLKDILMKY